MGKNKDFIQNAATASSYTSETKILNSIADKDKAIVLWVKKLELFQNNCFEVFDEIDRAKQRDLTYIVIKDDGTISNEGRLADRTIDEAELQNLINSEFKESKGYFFVVNDGIKFLYNDGEINTEVGNCLLKTKTMQEQLDILQSVKDLKNVFMYFKIDCEKYYDQCFDKKTKKVKKDIREHELREFLREYLSKKMKGKVDIEYNTDFQSDIERTDICINDGTHIAIIEVKFSFLKKYYLGNTIYNFEDRILVGYQQLDKYATHLAKDRRQVDYAYLYMFYMQDKDENELKNVVEGIINETSVSKDLYSVFEDVILNDMKGWIK